MREQDVAAVCALLVKSAEDQAVVSAIRIELDQGSVAKERKAEGEGLWFIFLRLVLRIFAIFLAPVLALWAVLIGRLFGPRDECVARIHTEEPLPEIHIHAPVLPSVLGWRPNTVCRNDVRKAARLLRQHKKIPTISKQAYHSLDFLATVNATARAAGNFVPVGQTKVSVRRFVILIDRSRPDEFLALLF